MVRFDCRQNRRYIRGMGIELTPEQESLANQAVEAGHFSSVEDFVQAAVLAMCEDLEASAETRLGLSTDQLHAELRKGFESGPAEPWEGAASFNARIKSDPPKRGDGNGR